MNVTLFFLFLKDSEMGFGGHDFDLLAIAAVYPFAYPSLYPWLYEIQAFRAASSAGIGTCPGGRGRTCLGSIVCCVVYCMENRSDYFFTVQ